MKENIEKIIRQLRDTVREERKVRRAMFPDLQCPPEDEYPCKSRDEMCQAYMSAGLDLDVELPEFIRAAAKMPKPFGDMFCYVVYCDLHERMKMYQALMNEILQSETSVTRATQSETTCVSV